jgi:hypothetical protein
VALRRYAAAWSIRANPAVRPEPAEEAGTIPDRQDMGEGEE